MAEVVIHEAGAASNTPAAADLEVVTDARGRKLKLKRPTILQESRVVRMMGEAAMNASYMSGYVLPAVMVVDIDGQAVPFPNSEREIEAAIQRLDHDGVEAVLGHILAQAKDKIAEAEEGAAVKN